jgi:hypothetical protein
MTNEMIENYLTKNSAKNSPVNIHFKQRSTVKGIFIETKDYNELKTKNLWRIVSSTKLVEWTKTRDENLARIFNGSEFTRLTID